MQLDGLRSQGTLGMAAAVAGRVFRNFINGECVSPKGAQTYSSRNLANTEEIIREFPWLPGQTSSRKPVCMEYSDKLAARPD